METEAANHDNVHESDTECRRAADTQQKTILLKEVLERCVAEQLGHSYVLVKLYR
jgi:hypothetical protein